MPPEGTNGTLRFLRRHFSSIDSRELQEERTHERVVEKVTGLNELSSRLTSHKIIMSKKKEGERSWQENSQVG